MSDSFSLSGTVVRRKNFSRKMTFLHVMLDAPISVGVHLGVPCNLASGTIVQLVCAGDAPAPRLARGSARVEAQGRLEPGRLDSAQVSVLASHVALIAEPLADAGSAAPQPAEGGSSLCRAWLKGYPCAAGSACKFQHAIETEEDAKKVSALAERAAVSRAADDWQVRVAAETEGTLCGAFAAHKAGKGARHSLFASWIVATYGTCALRAGTGVVDVAGGKGFISLELVGMHGVPSTVLDPEPRRPGVAELRALRRRWAERGRGQDDSGDNLAVAYLDAALPDGAGSDVGQYVHDDATSSLVAGASLLIGMHSDEATEAIVDAGLRHRVNFAVVPCCAFPSRFPTRTLQCGAPVATTAQFIAYLKAKAPDGVIRQDLLPFEGRNVVLYTTGTNFKP